MSGFEIAGVVLGAFPLLWEAATGLRGVFKDVGLWWRFEREFETFILDLEKEHIAFSQILDILLEPLDNLSQDEKQALRNDPDSPLWFDLRIQKELEHRVQAKFLDHFMRELQVMNDALNELHTMLPFDKVHHLDSKSLASEMFRIKTSFSHKKDRILSDIRKQNASLYKFLQGEQTRRLAGASAPTPSKGSDGVIASLLEFQEQAKSIFMGFQRHWTCTCAAASHPCRISARDSDVRVLVDNGPAMTHIKVNVEKTMKPPALSKMSAPQVSTKHEDVAVLRQHVSLKNRFSKLKEKSPRSILKMTTSTLSSLSNPAGVDTHGSQEGSEEPADKVPKRPKVAGALSIRTLRFHFDSDPPPCTQVVDGATTGVLQVHEAISDMCLVIKQKEPYLGFLEAPDARVVLHLDSVTQQPDFETLEDFMNATPRRDARLQLGLSITFSMLKLGPSWVPENWHKSSLVLLRTTEPLPYPYISHPSIQATLKANSAAEAARAKESLLTLGILILELLFHDTLERQPFRATYLSNGKPNNMTDLCTAMEWQKKVEAEFGDRIADVIRRCVYCAFGPAPNLSSSEFLQAIWLTVVKPLEEFLKVYSNVV